MYVFIRRLQMACFRKEDYSQLSLDHAKRIPELDLEYSHLQNTKASLLKAAQAKLRVNQIQLAAARAALVSDGGARECPWSL